MSPRDRFEPVIGLEVHVHLRTESKMFCACAVRYGGEPNHQVCPVCLALPGALPALNARAVELAVRAALALDGEVRPRSVFARKNYFYPDLPKGYQISQYEEPLMLRGSLEIETTGDDGEPAPRRIGITRLHMEEDAGKSVHDEAERTDDSQMDLNRAGVPLLEIVSEPELRSAAEASAYLRALRQVLRYVGASDADMEKGQMRCDVNLSLRPRGSTALGTRTETKNVNSFRFVEEAIEAEIERQAEVLAAGGSVVQATMLFDPGTGRTRVMRVKENADDYRYFPDPDLVPLELEPGWLAAQRAELPELPARRRARFEQAHGLSAYDARLLTASRALADFFEATVAAHGHAKTVANWILRDVLALLREAGREIEDVALSPAALAALLGMIDAGRVTAQSARDVLRELVERGGDPEALVRERGLEAVSDSASLEPAVEEVLAAHPEMAAKVRAGETKVLNFLMGQVMKRTGGKANPAVVRELLARRLGS
jgi:aspartyl-tRNA(Asn)/glutamyl-tRNA(Gln) amidotransferase subunit B